MKTNSEVYDCDNANHCVTIKNLLEYTPMYSNSVAIQMNFIFLILQEMLVILDITRNVQHVRNAAVNGEERFHMVAESNPDYDIIYGTIFERTRMDLFKRSC